jgi:hypothetical protein
MENEECRMGEKEVAAAEGSEKVSENGKLPGIPESPSFILHSSFFIPH